MKGNRDGQKPWSEDDLFDLDSALAWGGNIEDIADFLGREVLEVERKASERNLLIDRHMVPGEKRPPAASVRRDTGADQVLQIGGRKTGQ
jgi:hypothetical protein